MALFADSAIAHPDGKLYLMGGGVHRVQFGAFPATQPRLALALGIELSADETDMSHTVTIEATNATIMKPLVISFSVSRDERGPGELYYVHLVANIDGLVLPAGGVYRFAISIDGTELETLDLVAARLSGASTEQEQSMARLQEGYEAFVNGNAELAEEIFRDVVARFPGEPNGPNNLGFVLLYRGKAEEAMPLFENAHELGFTKTEIFEANVGCAMYALGDFGKALEAFQRCIRQNLFTGPATLFGISHKELFPLSLSSAGEYVSLMTLNAAWSALSANEQSVAAHYLAAARAAEVNLRHDVGGQRYVESVKRLEAQARGGKPES